MMFAVVTLVHVADTLKQLDADTETLLSIGREHLCQFAVLRYQQEDGLNTVLPYGLRRVKSLRTLTTESTAVLMPFRAQEIQDPGGLYYGVNAVSKNLLICDRKRLISPHAFELGVSGSGKSMAMKSTIANIALATNDDIIIIDAEREYGPLTRALGGEVIEISPPQSPPHQSPGDRGWLWRWGKPHCHEIGAYHQYFGATNGGWEWCMAATSPSLTAAPPTSTVPSCTPKESRPRRYSPTGGIRNAISLILLYGAPNYTKSTDKGHRIWVRGRYPGAHLGDRHGASQFHIALFQK